MQQLEAHEVPLHKIFSSDYDFRIPDYQRPYAWEVEQASQLLEDLSETLDRADDEPYFLGSIVLVKAKESSDAEVIDGQQRLTTLTIILAVLRDLAEDAELTEELERMLQEPGSLVMGLEKKPRLTLRKRDSDFFRQQVQDAGTIESLVALDPNALKNDSQRAIRSNAEALRTTLSTWDPGRRMALTQMLGMRTFLVVVSTPDLDSAHRIFSVMNARGLDLSPSDIFKATVIGQIEKSDSDTYTDRWESAEESLGRDDFADLFLHIRMIVHKERARRELLKEFPEQVLNAFLPGKAREFVDDLLVPYADAYGTINGESYTAVSGAAEVNAWFRRLSQLDNNDWRPAALWALRHYRNEPEWLDGFYSALERLASSMFVRRVYTTPRVTRYAELLKELDQGLGLDSPALRLSSDERAETLTRLGGDVYQFTKTRKYILLRLDERLAKDPGVTYAHGTITVEHVLPQNPSANSPWLENFSEEQREYWTHRLANLVLLNQAKNSEASNLPFATKKAKYFTGKNGVAAFALTSQVLTYEEWTPSVLEQRQIEVVSVLEKVWRLEPGDDPT